MSNLDFVMLVKKMRDCQKEYFRTRDKEVLQESKNLEKKVDSCIARMLNGSLFEFDVDEVTK